MLERNAAAGGAVRSEALTQPGYVHDTYSAFYGLLHASPVFADLELGRRVQWARHDVPVSAVIDPTPPACVTADPARTAAGLAAFDAGRRSRVARPPPLVGTGRLAFPTGRLSPLPSARPGLRLLRTAGRARMLELAKTQLEPIEAFVRNDFRSPAAGARGRRHLAHRPRRRRDGSTPPALILVMLAQQVGMPVPVGGAGRLTDAAGGGGRGGGRHGAREHGGHAVVVERTRHRRRHRRRHDRRRPPGGAGRHRPGATVLRPRRRRPPAALVPRAATPVQIRHRHLQARPGARRRRAVAGGRPRRVRRRARRRRSRHDGPLGLRVADAGRCPPSRCSWSDSRALRIRRAPPPAATPSGWRRTCHRCRLATARV